VEGEREKRNEEREGGRREYNVTYLSLLTMHQRT
jgi:hypothetical protein